MTLTAYIPDVRASTDTLLDRARPFLPPEAMAIVEAHLHGLVGSPRPHLLTLGLAVTLYSASRGVDAVRKTLNRAYDVKESRPLWKTEALAFGMTIGGAMLVLVGIAALVAGGSAGLLGSRASFTSPTRTSSSWRWLRWPVTALAIMLSAALSYYAAPRRRSRGSSSSRRAR